MSIVDTNSQPDEQTKQFGHPVQFGKVRPTQFFGTNFGDGQINFHLFFKKFLQQERRIGGRLAVPSLK